MAAFATRKHTAKMVAPESSKALGTLHLLPAGAPEAVEPSSEPHVAAAAMPAPGGKDKGAAKSAPKLKAAPTSAGDLKSKGQKSGSTGLGGDPDVAYAFTVKIDSVAYAMFSEISGLSWKAEPIPVRVGGNNEYTLNMRGPGKFEPLTLKRGWFASTGQFFDMLKHSLEGSSPRSSDGRVNMTISVLDRKYKEIGAYDFKGAFIIEYAGPALNAMSGQIGFEQIRMAYDYFTYKPKG